ncbi:MAG TPA: carboxypeptidase-like regulatory domain-containing protein, partial [Thermoplasmata archaeon]|nr:carboxypeptidase-like regulatory domain-containing protein [Thermoplasmata archaeon]
MPSGVPRFALWALVVMMLATSLVSAPGARATNGPSSYVLSGHVTTAGGVPVPAGVSVDLISGATHQVYTTTTSAGGAYSFTYGATSSTLGPGNWGVWVPPQGNITLRGSQWGVLPANPQPTFFYETAQNLTSPTSGHTITGVSVLKYNATIFGNATDGASPAAGANVELLAPGYNGFVLSNNTTLNAGNFSLKVPWGTWVLRTTLPGVPDQFDYQRVVVDASTVANGRLTVNPAISKYLTYGTIYQTASPTVEVPYGGNVTVFDTGTGDIYSAPIVGGGFYGIGTYPSGFSGSGAETFNVVLQSIGYQTVNYSLTVSGANTTGPIPHDVWAPAQYAPANYTTSLTYSKNFKWLNTSSSVTLGNDSVFPELPNASVGQLWAQLALDWQHNLTFSGANLGTVQAWIASEGPFFPAGAAQAMVNSTGYNESNAGNFTFSSTCGASAYCGLTSSAGISYSWAKDYSLNGSAPINATSYPVAFNFRHPTNFQSINYTITLPSGYALQAGTSAPAGARLVAGGPGGTWTKFTLVSLPWSSPSGTASFTVVKYGSITANVTASVSSFTFAKQNVLNSTHGNYSVIVGAGQNVTFSAAASTFPSGINGSRYVWAWGDSTPTTTTTQVTTYHTFATAGKYDGTLNVTSSGGTSATVAFHVYVGSGGITGNITSNASAAQSKVSNGVPYLEVNYSTSLTFNATGFTSNLGFAGAPAGVLSVASWNATDGPKNQTSNFTAGQGAYVPDNFTVLFNAAGDTQYLSSATVGGATIQFLGWQYNITVRVWDADGKYATQRLIVLVQDTQKPVAVTTV